MGTTFVSDGVIYKVLTPSTVQVGDGSEAAVVWGTSSVSIPKRVTDGSGASYSVTAVGANAFYWCLSLTSATIPDSVTTIGDDAFVQCPLATFSVPDSVSTIGNQAFMRSGLESVTIGKSVQSIGGQAFTGCESLSSITIPDSVVTLGNQIFLECSNLKTVELGKSLTEIPDNAFDQCTALASVNIPPSVTAIGSGAFFVCGALTNVKLPESVQSIAGDAFASCGGLRSINIPDSVLNIEDETFGDDPNLTTVTIGKSVASIGPYAFFACSSLASVTVPASTRSVGMYAFAFCSSLSTAAIGPSVTSIGGSAFYECTSLASSNLPSRLSSVGDLAFYDCSSLILNAPPPTLTSVGSQAFQGVRWSMASATVSGVERSYPFTGTAITPTATVTFGGSTLTSGTDYSTDYENNQSTGVAAITVTGLGDYVGSMTRTFAITPAAIGGALVSNIAAAYPFTGQPITPTPVVTLAGVPLDQGRDYGVSYAGNVLPGQASITISALGLRTGVTSLRFAIQFRLSSPKVAVRRHGHVLLRVIGGYGPTKWLSLNPRIATVSARGRVVGLKAGITWVTARRDGRTFRCRVLVKTR